jgi:hypothetical protein
MEIIQSVQNRIYLIRGQRVILDKDIAFLYETETKVLNQSVNRNIKRFPIDFMFQLTKDELDLLRIQKNQTDEITPNLRSQFVTSSFGWGGTRYPPYAFTEQGITMLASVLNSERAILANIEIVRAFVRLRELIADHQDLAKKLQELECKYDGQFRAVFEAIRQIMQPPQGPKRKIGINVD